MGNDDIRVCPPYEVVTSRNAGYEYPVCTSHALHPISPGNRPSAVLHGAYCAAEHPSTVTTQYVAGQTPKIYLYQPVTPLHDLGPVDALIDCPHCGARTRTKTSPSSGNMNHTWAGCLFITTFIFACLPYMITGLKNVKHSCHNCGKVVAVWHRSGHTVLK